MQKILTKLLLIFAICHLLFANISVSFAEDEDIGFVKRLWRKLINKEKYEKKEILKEPHEVLLKDIEVSEEKDMANEAAKFVLTKEQMIEVMNHNLSIYGDEIRIKIPEIVKETIRDKIVYRFKKDTGEITDFEALDEEVITGLYRRVVNEAVVIRTDRLNKQLQQQMQMQQQQTQLMRTQQQMQRPVTPPPQPPKVQTPPNIPPPPPQPPQTRR